MIKVTIHKKALLLLFFTFLISCEKEDLASKKSANDAPGHEIESASNVGAKCLSIENFLDEKHVCRPNGYYFFSHAEEYEGKKVLLDVFATYGARGRLNVYPFLDAACSGLDYSGIEIEMKTEIPEQVEKKISNYGTARVRIMGSVSVRSSQQVIATLLESTIAETGEFNEILLSNPMKWERGNPKVGEIGSRRAEKCTEKGALPPG